MIAVVFTNPALWAGGTLALGVPLFIHLLTRKTTQTLRFPTLRFLQRARASQSRVFRFRHLILLLLRTAFVVLLLFAFLKPVLPQHSLAATGAVDQRHAVILILDASLCMRYTVGGVSPFARARVAAEKIIDDLGPNDVANLILAGAAPVASSATPTDQKFPLRYDLQAAAATLERADIDAAIAEAVQQLGRLSGVRKEIHLISDFQRNNWAAVKFAAIPQDVKVVFIPVGLSDAGNIAVTDVLLQPSAPTAGEDVEVIAKVANYSPVNQQTTLELRFSDNAPIVRDVTLPAHTTVTTSYRVRVPHAGLSEGELRLPDDNLPEDNRRYFTLTAAERLRVCVMSDEPRDDPSAAHRYVMRALNPFGPGQGSLEPVLLAAAEFDKFAAARAPVTILAGVRELPPALWPYLRDGGGVIWFLCGPADAANLAKLQAAAGGDLTLPMKLGAFTAREATFNEANFDDPLLRPFREARDLNQIRCLRYFATERVPAQGEVLLRYDDHTVALARKTAGLGSLLLANFSPSLAASDLAKRTIFVPLIHEMVKAVRPPAGALRTFVAGQPASLTVPAPQPGQTVGFTSPSGEKVTAMFEEGKTDASVIFPVTRETGLYRVNFGEQCVGAVAVNVDSRESDLEALSPRQIQEQSELARDRFLVAAGTNLPALQRLREGRPLWHYCLLAALCLLGVEQWFAAWGRR